MGSETNRQKGNSTMWRPYSLFAIVFTVAAGCGDLFEVENPTNILEEGLDDPEILVSLSNASEAAVSRGYTTALLYAGQVADEGWFFSTRSDRISLAEGYMDGWNENYDETFNQFATARWLADDMIRRLEGGLIASPAKDARVASAYYWAGLSRLILADYFQEVPFDGKPPLTPVQTLEQAATYFEKAAQIAAAAGDRNLQAAALGSKARAQRSLYWDDGDGTKPSHFAAAGQTAERALAARRDYFLGVRHSPPATTNRLADTYRDGQPYQDMHARYANLKDPVSGKLDPRIKHSAKITTGRGNVDYYEVWKWSGLNSPVAVSRWEEARLVLAEAYLVAKNLAGAVEQINIVRASVGLPPFSSSDAGQILKQIQYERIAEFWLEGRRWQDMRYYNMNNSNWALENQKKGIDRRWPVSDQEKSTNPYYRK